MTIAFTWITREDGLAPLRAEWEALSALDDAPGSIFRSFPWLTTWWQTLGKKRGRELRVLVGRDPDGTLRGVVPMYVEKATLVGDRRLRLLGDTFVGSDYLGLCASRPDRLALAQPFARHLATDPILRDVDSTVLLDLPEDDTFTGAAAEAVVGAGFADIDVPRRYICPVAVWGGDFEGWLGSRPQRFGSQARNRRKELAKKPGFELAVVSDAPAVTAGLEDLFRLHQRRWQEEGGSQAFGSAAIETFHRRVAPLLAARGVARLATLRVGGEAVASAYGFHVGERFLYYQAGLLPEWRKRSVGTVVMVELMRHAAEAGAREADFLRGDEPYKALWATTARATCAIQARRATRAARARDALARLRESFKAAMPEPALLFLKRLRARLGHGI